VPRATNRAGPKGQPPPATPKDADLGRYKSAESKARAEANLPKGRAKPGEARRNNFNLWLETEAAKIEALLADQPPGEPSVRERQMAKLLARMEADSDRAMAWLGVNPNNPSAQAWRKVELVARLGKGIADLYAQLHQAGQDRVARELHKTRPLEPPKSAERARAVAQILARQGALNRDPEIGKKARDLSAAIDRQRADKRAVNDEFYGVPPKETPDA
jgi:hypothetical protein